ncbi:MAG: hypothetical protein ABJO09_00620 [Hyphomicrobiales bacterium]
MPHSDSEILTKLSALLQRETDLIKAGDLTSSALLQSQKNTLIEEFQTTMKTMSDDQKLQISDQLKKFNELLAENMSALSIAKDISADIIKRVSDVVNGPRKTNSYGANGLKPSGPLPARRGIAVDKGF